VIEGACNGMCYAAPSVEVHREGWPRFLIERLDPVAVPTFLERLATDRAGFASAGLTGIVWADRQWRDLVPVAEQPFWKNQERVLMARCGPMDPEDLDDALLRGAYRALARALGRPPVELIEMVKASGLQGRGGAFFPTAVKWDACRRATGLPKYVVVNGEEGEPGIFKDRHLMEGDPHQLLEGALLAAYAAGATRVILYVHGEAHLSAARLARAAAQAEAAGIIGDRMLGSDAACHVELRRGAGGFILGEETALLESIEGRRAQPRTRPPFPVESGLWGRPTVINNVETLSAIPAIVAGGAAWFAALGTPKAPGTKVFGLSGPIRRPGVVEVRNGVTLRTLLDEIGGGLVDGSAWQGAVVGGPSGTIVPAALFEVPMEPRERVSPGTGGIVAVPVGASVVDIVKTLLRFNAAESCGKCTPCREGTPRLLAMIDELGSAVGREERLVRVQGLAETIQLASLCGLGQAAPLALLRGLETFAEAFRDGA
jgi:NADH:ubiquinone oxidoreductase subunit F (NADH-binding)